MKISRSCMKEQSNFFIALIVLFELDLSLLGTGRWALGFSQHKQWCTSLKDLIKGTAIYERNEKERQKSSAVGGIWTNSL